MADERLDLGLHDGKSMEAYVAARGPDGERLHNQSFLKLFAQTASKARQSLVSAPPPTPAMEFGTAVHSGILEPEDFEDSYVAAPSFDRRTKKGKDGWAVFNAEHADKTVLTQDNFDRILAMRDSVHSTTMGNALLRGDGLNELTAVWKDPETNLSCKARLDRYTKLADQPIVADVKTCLSADPDEFAKSIAKFSYHMQAAFYLDGVQNASGGEPVDRKFVFIAIEKTAPFDCAFYELDPWAVERGRFAYRICLGKARDAQKTDTWPGYDDAIKKLDLPPWAKDAHALTGDEPNDLYW